VIDKGVGATNTQVILNQLEANLKEYNPDMVVAMIGINDWGQHIPYEAATSSKITLFLKSFRTYKLARLLWLHIKVKTRELGLSYLPITRLKEAYAEPLPSEDALKKAIELNPKNDNAYAELGLCYRDQDKCSQAEDAFKKAIELNPKNENAYLDLGWCYQGQGKSSQAEDAFRSVIELNPKNENAYLALGAYYQNQGKFSQAENAFKKVIELNSKSYKAYAALGVYYQDQGNLSQAEDSLKKAIELNPESDLLYGTCSVLYEAMGKPELAREYANRANSLRLKYYVPGTVKNYRKLKEILTKRSIRLICVQYPMRSIEPLKKIFEDDTDGIIFVDNEKSFKEGVSKSSYKEYFHDIFGGDFGHCTDKGNRLLAENIANTILKEVFNK
jgi:Tfp pilus assembly protein PilF